MAEFRELALVGCGNPGSPLLVLSIDNSRRSPNLPYLSQEAGASHPFTHLETQVETPSGGTNKPLLFGLFLKGTPKQGIREPPTGWLVFLKDAPFWGGLNGKHKERQPFRGSAKKRILPARDPKYWVLRTENNFLRTGPREPGSKPALILTIRTP